MAIPQIMTDAPATRDRRRAILARTPLTAGLAEAHRAALLAASSLKICPPGTVLFAPGQAPREVFVIGSGFVQMRVSLDAGFSETDIADEARALHWQLLGMGDLVADHDLVNLVAGAAGSMPRRNMAVVMGEPAEILFIRQQALARVLSEDETARVHLAKQLARGLESLIRLTSELAILKNFGKARLARFLLELFDRMGRMRNGHIELSQGFSHADIAALLGLTRRSVFDDMTALEDFDAIDHDRRGRLSLRDRARLERIAGLGQDTDRELACQSWREDVEAAFAAGDTALAFDLARESLLYHPRDSELRYSATLAALRAGDLGQAARMIDAFGFARGGGGEREASLAARAEKERAFACQDRATLSARAKDAACAYLSVHRRTGGTYAALNAAAMFALAGDPESARLAKHVLHQAGRETAHAYWDLATIAEAHWLLGEAGAAQAAAIKAHAAPDADDGKRCTTRRQFRRLAAGLDRTARDILAALPVAPVFVCPSPPTQREAAALSAEAPARILAVVSNETDAREIARFDLPALELVLTGPEAGETSALAQTRSHLAWDGNGGLGEPRLRHARRHALGLACLLASEREARLPRLAGVDQNQRWPDWAADDTPGPGQAALLSVDGASGLAESPAAEARAEVDGTTILRFSSLGAALDAAFSILAHASEMRAAPRICLDLSPAVPDLAGSRLGRIQPATPPGEIAATAWAAAELALLRAPDLKLASIGRVRSRRRLGRLAVWSVRHGAAWA